MKNSGLLLLNKKPGITSFDALRDIKRALGTGKVGHTGTLDKFAQGLLIVLAGRGLKLSRWFSDCDKQYTGTIRFGIETDTLDPEGCIIAQAENPSRDDVEKILGNFTGSIMQAPPAYSAIHINGKRASDLARSGETPEMKKRPVTIYKLNLVSWQPPFAEIFIHCSSGTYIRSLARDIALAAGSRAHLSSLLRTQVAGFKLEMEPSLPIPHSPTPNPYSLTPINKEIIQTLGLPYFEITSQEKEKIIQGKSLDQILNNKPLISQNEFALNASPLCGNDFSAAVFQKDDLVAMVEKTCGKWKYGCVFSN